MKLLFERSRPGRGQDLIPACDVPQASFDPSFLREKAPRLPEISEVDLGRHYTELAGHTHGVRRRRSLYLYYFSAGRGAISLSSRPLFFSPARRMLQSFSKKRTGLSFTSKPRAEVEVNCN